jgi:hypothetical protein
LLGGGSAYALTLARDSVGSRQIKDNAVKKSELANDAVTASQVLNGLLQVDGAGSNVDADLLDGKSSHQFLSSSVYKTEATTDQGTLLGDGSRVKSMSCDPGDLLLSGGPASVNINSDVLDSFATSAVEWQARITDNGQADNFTVVILCVDQS